MRKIVNPYTGVNARYAATSRATALISHAHDEYCVMRSLCTPRRWCIFGKRRGVSANVWDRACIAEFLTKREASARLADFLAVQR